MGRKEREYKEAKRYSVLRNKYGSDNELIEFLELHSKLGIEGLIGADRETIENETHKLMGVLELKTILLDKPE